MVINVWALITYQSQSKIFSLNHNKSTRECTECILEWNVSEYSDFLELISECIPVSRNGMWNGMHFEKNNFKEMECGMEYSNKSEWGMEYIPEFFGMYNL